MHQVTTASSASGTPGFFTSSKPVFEAEEGDESCQHWGALLSVFGDGLDAAVQRMNDVVPGTEDLVEDVQGAARRYGAMLEAMCMGDSRASNPCLLYDCAEGFSVLMVQQRATSPENALRASEAFDVEQTSVPEQMFTTLLGQAMTDFFQRHVTLPEGLVTVQLDGCEYLFLRSSQRDTVLRDLKIGTSADVY